MRAIDSDFESKIPRTINSGLLSETMDADQGGSDFVDTLPTPEITNTQELISTTTPAAPAPKPPAKPTDAMLRGKEMSQIQFEGMEPVYGNGHQGSQGDLLGYKFTNSQVPDTGLIASYSKPVYGPHNNLIDPGGKLLGYVPDTSKTYDVPKPAEILAAEKQFGTTMEPIYAKNEVTRGSGGGKSYEEYGPPIGYRFDNGKSQYVNFDASGAYQNTETREKGGINSTVLSILSIAYPPIAPFIQAYNAVKALDNGDTLGFILSATGAGKSIPGLDKSTISMLNNISTGAKIIQAVESKDPLKILSATSSIPNVDPDLKDLSIVLTTAKAVTDGNISGAINGISKMSDRDSVGRLTDRFNDIVGGQNVAALDPSQVAALTPATDENINNTLTNAGLVRSDVIDDTIDTDAQEKADREQAARDAIRTSDKTIEDTLADSGLVKTDEKKLNEVDVTGKTLTDTDLPITGDQGRNKITDFSLPVNPNVGTPVAELEKQTVTGKALTDTDLPIIGATGNNRITDSSLPVNPDVGGNKLDTVTVTGKRELADLIPLKEAKPLPDNTVKEVIAGTPQEPKPTVPTIPNIPKLPTTPAKPTTPVKTVAPAATPAEQLYQTTTQSNPTTLADIKYYLDMASGGAVPPQNQHDPLESLLNQPMSVEELLYHLRS